MEGKDAYQHMLSGMESRVSQMSQTKQLVLEMAEASKNGKLQLTREQMEDARNGATPEVAPNSAADDANAEAEKLGSGESEPNAAVAKAIKSD